MPGRTDMSNQIGRFEIISQVAQSSATVYKALDTQTQETVALKVIRLEQARDRDALMKKVLEEADQAKPLSSHNIATLYGVGEEEGQLLAATEYVQGNSIATTLARREGFSIWDLQDIARQACQALDHAHVHKVVHVALEPAKIMVQWDGMVKVLGFGISSMNGAAVESAGVQEILHYAAPEQLRGEACDHRSALFSLGAILYEMATEQKAFPGETLDQVHAAILEGTPPLPVRLKPNVNPALSDLIMKALSKSPDERYQSGQELINDLEQCKNAGAAGRLTGTKPKAQAAAAGAGGSTTSSAKPSSLPASMLKPAGSGAPVAKASVSAPVADKPKPAFAVDPMMAEGDESSPAATVRKSFSEMSELPPLKEIYIETPVPPTATEITPEVPAELLKRSAPEKPKVQVREAAQKAVTAIRKTPPKLYLYALGGAAVLIALIVAGISISNYLQDRQPGGSASTRTTTPPPGTKASLAPAPPPTPTQSQPDVTQPREPEASQSSAAAASGTKAPRGKRGRVQAVPAVVSAQLSVSSNPAGAQISFDGSALCESPCTLTGIAPGNHTVSASKAGYSGESRTVSISSGANLSVSIDLSQLVAKLLVASSPAGGAILIDGKDSGKLTPSQFSLDNFGTHSVTVRRYGYLEESTTINAEAGQTANVNLTLKQLGSTDEIRSAGGKFKKVFGGNDTASMGVVSIKTQPKGAQIMLNNRVLDKTSPFDFYLNPGTYVVDITLSGYRAVHRVINVEQREKVAMEVTLNPE
jgi:serine/threonine protein kinase